MTDEPAAPEDVEGSPEARCIGCGYDLRAMAVGAKCPECGLPVIDSIRGGGVQGVARVERTDDSVLGGEARDGCLKLVAGAGATGILLALLGPIEVLAIPLLVVSFFCVACAIGVVLNARSATDRGCLWALGLAAAPVLILLILLVRVFA